jgi:DNA-binding GntR family transcriptional regulator
MTSKTEDIVQSVSDAILSHRLLPGTQLREVSLGRLYGVSRTVVRQALQQLAKDGLVDLASGKIAAVAQPTPKEAREVFDLRMAIEKHALRTLIQRATHKDLAKLRAHLKMERAALSAKDTVALRKLGAGFHVLLARLAGNDLLADLLEQLTARIALILVVYQHDYDLHVECLQDEHQRFIELIDSKSVGEAMTLMESHLKIVETSLKMADTVPAEDLPLQRALQV